MAENKADRGKPPRHALDQQPQDRPRRVGREFEPRRGHQGAAIGAAVRPGPRRRERVDEQHGAAAVELLQQRREPVVAEPGVAVVGRQADAVHVQHVVGVGELGKGGVRVAQRQGREQPEPPGMIEAELHSPLVPAACLRRAVGGAGVGRGRQAADGGGDAVAVQLVDGHVDRPGAALVVLRRRAEMVVDVYGGHGRMLPSAVTAAASTKASGFQQMRRELPASPCGPRDATVASTSQRGRRERTLADQPTAGFRNAGWTMGGAPEGTEGPCSRCARSTAPR